MFFAAELFVGNVRFKLSESRAGGFPSLRSGGEVVEKVVNHVFVDVGWGVRISPWFCCTMRRGKRLTTAKLLRSESLEPSGRTPGAFSGSLDAVEEIGEGFGPGILISGSKDLTGASLFADRGGADTDIAGSAIGRNSRGDESEEYVLFGSIKDDWAAGAGHGRARGLGFAFQVSGFRFGGCGVR
jgi:hypothetical protein